MAAILEATAQVLVELGYARLTTTRVAERAGVSVGTLYQYFGDKDALVRALKEAHVERIMGAMARAAAESAELDPPGRIRAMLSALLAAKAAAGPLSTVLSMTMVQLDGRVALEQGVESARRIVRGVLEESREQLHIDDPEIASFTIVHAVEGVIGAMVTNPPRPLDDPRNVDELVRIVTGYLGVASAKS